MIYQKICKGKLETVKTEKNRAVGIIKKVKKKAKEDVLKTIGIKRM